MGVSTQYRVLEVSEILHLPYAEQTSPEALHEIRQVSAYLELLRKGAALDEGYLELATEGCLKSRMRENCTSSSVRGSRQTLHSRNIVKGVSRRSTRLKEMDERETDGRREVAVTDIEAMVPENHLVRKIKKVMDYERGADRNDRGYLS